MVFEYKVKEDKRDNACFKMGQSRTYLSIGTRNRPDQEILVPDWLITSHVTGLFLIGTKVGSLGSVGWMEIFRK